MSTEPDSSPEIVKPRVTFVTAGGAGMYCGSCMRDNTLVRNLSKLGWEIELLPAYTPVTTDEEDVSVDHVFFGGLNMYLQQNIPLFRWMPKWMDRWLDNPNVIKRATSKSVKVNGTFLGKMTLATVEGEHGVLKKEHRNFVNWLREHSRPDLINLTNLLIGGSIPMIRAELPGKPLLVTLQGDDLFLDQLEEPWRSKVIKRMREVAKEVDGYITFNRYYAGLMGDILDIPEEKFHIVPLGIEVADFENIERELGHPPTVGYFARICPEKGFHHAVDAFILLAKEPGMEHLRFKAGGWLGADHEDFFAEQKKKLEAAGLMHRFEYVGAPDREGKLTFFRHIDLLSVPTEYREAKGMYVLEAMASGIPVVQPAHGSFPEMLEDSGAGLLVEPNNPKELADAWKLVLTDAAQRAEYGRSGRAHVHKTCTAPVMAMETAKIYQQFLDSLKA